MAISMRGIYLVFISIFFNMVGQLSMKIGMQKFGVVEINREILINLLRIFSLPNIMLGLVFYAISAFFWLMALSKIELSVAYPTLSIGYVLILILSHLFLNESISVTKVLGTLLIVVGVYLVAR